MKIHSPIVTILYFVATVFASVIVQGEVEESLTEQQHVRHDTTSVEEQVVAAATAEQVMDSSNIQDGTTSALRQMVSQQRGRRRTQKGIKGYTYDDEYGPPSSSDEGSYDDYYGGYDDYAYYDDYGYGSKSSKSTKSYYDDYGYGSKSSKSTKSYSGSYAYDDYYDYDDYDYEYDDYDYEYDDYYY